MTSRNDSLLEVQQIRKQFPGVLALDGVSLHIQSGEVLAVVGENGAGKSTLMKILAGVYVPDSGRYLLDGREVHLAGVADALRRGVCLIHQELNLAENLNVAANLFLGRESTRLGVFLNSRAMVDASREYLARVGLACAPTQRVGDLPLGQRQLVEIARALAMNARVLIMDEPTSSLTQTETERLFEVIDDLKRKGVAVIYISHRLAEVKRLADRAVVLRDGKNAGELDRSAISHSTLVRLMIGRELNQFFVRQHRADDNKADVPRLEVRGLRYEDGPSTPVSLAVRRGEIVGMAGLVGAGRTELAESLFGIRKISAGEVRLDGKPVAIASPQAAMQAGLLLAPEDRRDDGLILEQSIRLNIGLANLDRLNHARLVARRAEKSLTNSMVERMRVRTPTIEQPVGLLSGGNQQKVVLGKWLSRNPKVLILDEPTRGVDVGAKREIYGLMDELAQQGVGILMISSDLEEILGMSDRVLVLCEGRLTGELLRHQLSEEAVMNLATGGIPCS
jgi:ribose transport system ATP-binding protein